MAVAPEVLGAGGALEASASRRVADVADFIYHLDADEVAFTRMLSMAKRSRKAKSTRFTWHSDLPNTRFFAVNRTQDTDDVVIRVTTANATLITVKDTIRNTATGELMHVQSKAAPSGGNVEITVLRSVGDTAAANVGGTAQFQILGKVYQEGSDPVADSYSQADEQWNYCQIMRRNQKVTETAKAVSYYGPSPKAEAIRKIGLEAAHDMASFAYFGQRDSVLDADGVETRFTGGVMNHWIDPNHVQNIGTLTEAAFRAWLGSAMEFGRGGDYILFAGLPVVNRIDAFATSAQRIEPGDNEWGVTITKYNTARGQIKVVLDDVTLKDAYGTAGTGVGADQYGFLLNMDHVGIRDLRTPVIDEKASLPGGDYDRYVITRETGFEWGAPGAHGLLTGVTDVA